MLSVLQQIGAIPGARVSSTVYTRCRPLVGGLRSTNKFRELGDPS